nr:hypothetical protein EC90111_A0003 [Escherichia coli 9.0111]
MYSYAHLDRLYYNIQMNHPATNFSSKKYQTGCSKVKPTYYKKAPDIPGLHCILTNTLSGYFNPAVGAQTFLQCFALHIRAEHHWCIISTARCMYPFSPESPGNKPPPD